MPSADVRLRGEDADGLAKGDVGAMEVGGRRDLLVRGGSGLRPVWDLGLVLRGLRRGGLRNAAEPRSE